MPDDAELTALVRGIAADPAAWRPLVCHVEGERHCASYRVDAEIGIWVISWMPGQDTGWHDHAGSSGAVVVVEGEVIEERPAWAHGHRRVQAGAGQTFTFAELDVHRVVAIGDRPAVTIHAYAPPLQEMGIYDVGEDGRVERRSIRWDAVLAA
jgi:mannose-6-phosphate isomerase-like protein (cupin superfamily)